MVIWSTWSERSAMADSLTPKSTSVNRKLWPLLKWLQEQALTSWGFDAVCIFLDRNPQRDRTVAHLDILEASTYLFGACFTEEKLCFGVHGTTNKDWGRKGTSTALILATHLSAQIKWVGGFQKSGIPLIHETTPQWFQGAFDVTYTWNSLLALIGSNLESTNPTNAGQKFHFHGSRKCIVIPPLLHLPNLCFLIKHDMFSGLNPHFLLLTLRKSNMVGKRWELPSPACHVSWHRRVTPIVGYTSQHIPMNSMASCGKSYGFHPTS